MTLCEPRIPSPVGTMAIPIYRGGGQGSETIGTCSRSHSTRPLVSTINSLCYVNCVLGIVAGAEGSDGLDKHGPYYPGTCGASNPRVAEGDRC